MSNIIVSVVAAEGGETKDFQIPSDMETREAAGFMAKAYAGPAARASSSINYRLLKLPGGVPLDPDATFAEAGIWDGAILRLEAEAAAPPSAAEVPAGTPPTPTTYTYTQPVTGWRPLDIPQPSPGSQEDKEPAAKSRLTRSFVWKRLD